MSSNFNKNSQSGAMVRDSAALEPRSTIADRLRNLFDVLTAQYDSDSAFYTALLDFGRQVFAAECGMVVRKIGAMGKIVCQQPQKNIVSLDNYYDLASSYCSEVIQKNRSLSFFSSKDRDVGAESLSYNWLNISNYLGAPILVGNQVYGVLSFFSTASSEKKYFSIEDLETIELMAKGVAKMIELQSPQAKESVPSGKQFATPGVKSFDEYLLQARLPEVYGVPGRVVEVLKRRISHSSLAIDHIASELNLSKRTLQRRLQQQNISFAELRDQVRFHYSIDYLIEQNMSIDSISSALDFSDRTSFTNAFKRWTNLSPSTFRKLFRDYA